MDIKKQHELLRRLLILFFSMIGLAAILIVAMVKNPEIFQSTNEYVTIDAPLNTPKEDAIVDGIHVSTGLKEGKGLQKVIQNCTNCHSAQLIIQNRMDYDTWKTTIKWMQNTQNLWDLGENEEIIINYLVTNYPVLKKGRRPNLKNIEWYTLP